MRREYGTGAQTETHTVTKTKRGEAQRGSEDDVDYHHDAVARKRGGLSAASKQGKTACADTHAHTPEQKLLWKAKPEERRKGWGEKQRSCRTRIHVE